MNGIAIPAYIGGIVRIVTTLFGGWLTQQGLASEGEVQELTGAVVLVVTAVWSVWAKRQALKTPPIKAGLSVLMLATAGLLLGGCATTVNRTPIMSESAGETVVAYATTFKLGFGNKEATSLGAYKLSANGGLSIENQSEQNDQSTALVRGLELGAQLGGLYLQKQGVPVGTVTTSAQADVSQEVAVPSTPQIVLSTAPKSVITGEGVPVVAILGNRVTCSRCRTLWEGLDAAALSEDLCGASVIDADKASNPSEYARLRPSGGFAYPLAVVYNADGTLAGQFDARDMTQTQVAAKVKALVPACAENK